VIPLIIGLKVDDITYIYMLYIILSKEVEEEQNIGNCSCT